MLRPGQGAFRVLAGITGLGGQAGAQGGGGAAGVAYRQRDRGQPAARPSWTTGGATGDVAMMVPAGP